MPKPTYDHIQTQTLSSAQSSVTLNLPNTYTDIEFTLLLKSNINYGGIECRLNSDSTAGNYLVKTFGVYGDGASRTTYNNNLGSSRTAGIVSWNACAGPDGFNTGIKVHLCNYRDSKYKTILARTGSNNAGGANGFNGNECTITQWLSTVAVTSITFSYAGQTFSAGSKFTAYGIKAG
jgi:hypothetical protein